MEFFKALAFVILLLLPIGGIGTCMVRGCAPDYSDGYRVGVVQKFSKKGLFWKSWEGEMVMQNLAYGNKGQPIGLEMFHFNVPNDSVDVQAEVLKAMDSGQRCRLTYRQFALSPITIDADQVITKAELVK